MSKIVGIDIGYGHTKATDGKKTYIFPTVVADAIDLSFSIQKKEKDIKNITATIDDRKIFVGELAILQGDNPIRFKSKDRAEDTFTKEVFLTTLGLFCDINSDSEVVEETFRIVTGLPVGDYVRYRNIYGERFLGRHEIELFGKKIILNITDMYVVPQPFGTWVNKVFTDDGKYNADFAERHVGIIDIGYRTSDFIQINQKKYIEKYAITADHGVSEIYHKLERFINDKYGIKKEDFELEQIVKQKQIYTRQHGVVELPIIDDYAKGLAQKLAKQIKSYWDNINSLEGIYITGGGGQMLYEYLSDILGKDIEVINSPQISNCIGYYKWGKSVFESYIKSRTE